MAKTHNKFSIIKNLLTLGRFSTSEMFGLDAEIGSVIFNTDIQNLVVFTTQGWRDMQGEELVQLNTIFYENFESGDFITNNWQVVNGGTNNWIVSDAENYTGDYSAIISNNNQDAIYNERRTQVSHIYKDVLLPTSSNISLDFMWKAKAEVNYDYGRVYIIPTTVTPQANAMLSSSYLVASDLNNERFWVKKTIDLTSYANTTIRLVLSWKNDSSVGSSPSLCVDNLLITNI